MEAPLSVARRLIGIDVRSLAVVRMLLGLLIVVDIVVRWGDFAIFYADSGIVSLHDSRAITAAPGAWSLYWLSTADAYQQALLAATAVGGVLLLLGCWTRWTTIACWVLVASLWNRNPLVCNYGDTLLRMLLFWGMFLPWGSTWSLDWLRGVRRGKNGVQGVTIHSAASAAILLQLTLLYFFTGLWKWNDDWIQGRALFHALNLEYFAGRPPAVSCSTREFSSRLPRRRWRWRSSAPSHSGAPGRPTPCDWSSWAVSSHCTRPSNCCSPPFICRTSA